MAFTLAVVVVVVGLLVSIALHEVGHMVPAKRFGVRVSQYMVGFGPTLWSRTRGETEYGLKAIPLGGYVRLVGMLPPADVVGAAPPRAGRMAELVADARAASAEEIRPGEDHRAFYRLSTPRKVVVMTGGPLMNLLIAGVLLAVVGVGIGVPVPGTTVASMPACVPAAQGRPCTDADPATPAEVAGVRTGDRLVAYDGVPTPTWEDFQQAVAGAGTAVVPLTVERAGEELTLQVEPALRGRVVLGADGAPVPGADGEPATETVPFVGVTPGYERERQSVGTVAAQLGDVTWQTARVVATLPVHVVEVGRAAFGGAERTDGILGPVGIGRVAGEIATTDAPGVTVSDRVATMLTLLAVLNVALFVFNMIPLLPLDGGHVAGALWEGARRQVARLRGRPRPAPTDVARMMPVAYGVFIALIGLGVLLLYADIVRPITL
ncbi:M50 family metallopeptidase [Cellulomonas bogoriensis]|uniref:Zinc metalloprotease n=1 Tax=Cellulomonas bogoriensis 69B4 = DSM 16987 TaxID=1386082 RepID=A0A0A0C1R6_9CELL|nr:RIP metalloprotease [Cellulomonas bogoriensis]KGM14136.1 zinc metalloprotease [Cellulomonas bogoriensis 69B4 = DSM 16987]